VAKSKVMVALRDRESVESLMALACQVASGMGADLMALHVVEVPMATPIEADDEILDRAGKEILLHAQKCVEGKFAGSFDTRLLRARQAGEAIVGEAQERGIECLVMGHRRLSVLGEILLGSSVQYVARHAPFRIVVEIPPVRRA
jgi:APA family basic amino acid/polyamine antiporter